MPCNCEYMEPSAAETRELTREKLRAVAAWDSSNVETLLDRRGMTAGAVRAAVAQYRQYAEDTIWNGKTPGRISVGADAVLHAHILFSADFEKFWGDSAFEHVPVENKVLKRAPALERVARYGAEKAVYDLLDVIAGLAGGQRGASARLQDSAKAALEVFMLDTPEFERFNQSFFHGMLQYNPLAGQLTRG